MSENEIDIDNLEIEEDKPKKKGRSGLTDKQLKARLVNLQKARDKRKAKTKKKKEQEDEYENIQFKEESDTESESEEDYYEPPKLHKHYEDYYEPPKSHKHKGIKFKGPSKKDIKEQERLDKIENMLSHIMKTQKKASRRPKQIKNTIIQVPKPESVGRGNDAVKEKIMSFFK